MAVKGMDNFRRNINKAIRDRKIAVKKTLSVIGDNHILEGSKRAPISPTKSEGGKGKTNPGTLRMSIKKQVYDMSVVIRVSANSQASDYAVSMHEDYYNLGQGSLNSQNRSGVEVGRKFFTRGRAVAVTKDQKILKKYLSV